MTLIRKTTASALLAVTLGLTMVSGGLAAEAMKAKPMSKNAMMADCMKKAKMETDPMKMNSMEKACKSHSSMMPMQH
jgi:pentapeptide MXKDX repeat protein